MTAWHAARSAGRFLLYFTAACCLLALVLTRVLLDVAAKIAPDPLPRTP